MEHVDMVRQWMHTQFMPMITPKNNMVRYGQMKIGESTNFKEYLLDFLHLADFNISATLHFDLKSPHENMEVSNVEEIKMKEIKRRIMIFKDGQSSKIAMNKVLFSQTGLSIQQLN